MHIKGNNTTPETREPYIFKSGAIYEGEWVGRKR